ncbi:MAG TPA: GAF domain-containing protein [Candidatus Sericytochromatia bacterium]
MHPSESVTNVPLNEHQTAATQTIGASLPLPDRPTSALEQPPTPLHLSVETLGAETVAIVPTLAADTQAGETQATDTPAWLSYFQQCSRLLIATIEPKSMTLQYANAYFRRLLGLPETGAAGELGHILQQLMGVADNGAIQRLYRRHLLYRVLQQFYQIDLQGYRLLDEPVMIALQSPLHPEPRYIEFWLRSEQLQLTRLDTQLNEPAALKLQQMALPTIEAALADPMQVERLEQQLELQHYQPEGCLLLEGLDVTEREIIRRITQLLVDRDSILRTHKFRELNQQMRSLFRAQNTLLLSIETDQIRLFMGSISDEAHPTLYPLEALQESHFMHALRTNQVSIVADLAQDPRTDGGRQLVKMGVRSLLLIPLLALNGGLGDRTESVDTSSNDSLQAAPPVLKPPGAVGVVALLSDQPHTFDALDCRHAEQLILAFTQALTTAQRQLVQQRLITNIHPSIEWRFLQEAERRSMGLPPEPIAFLSVYPLYGISDIRGSSHERNLAIQADLLEQFHLARAVVDSACNATTTALGEQLRLDLLEHIRQLQEGITVDAEVSRLRYLRDHLEIYFDYFAQCGEAAIAAINTYRNACANDHECVYRARTCYDAMVHNINTMLRETWERWQEAMQRITPHYCDIEATDGIDHMIYAGASIDPKFGSFQLRSLRYEQLRAVCACARTAFHLLEKHSTHMQITHLVLVQDATIDIFHDETTERMFDVRGSRDTRYEIVKKRIDKAIDEKTNTRITQPGMLTLVFCTEQEWTEYQQYFRYLMREGWIDNQIERGTVQPLQGVTGLKYARVRILPEGSDANQQSGNHSPTA